MWKRVALVAVCLAFAAGTAGAAELTSLSEAEGASLARAGGAGEQLNLDGGSVALAVGDRIVGPATLLSAGKSLRLSAKSVLVVQAAEEEGTELLFLEKGQLRGELTPATTIRTTVGWVDADPAPGRVMFYAESTSATRAYVEATQGKARVSYQKGRGTAYWAALTPGQGLELWISLEPEKRDSLFFRTGQANRKSVDPETEAIEDVLLVARVDATFRIQLYVPKATSGSVEKDAKDAKYTVISSDAGSWSLGKLGIATFKNNEAKSKGSLGPGAFARVNIETGEFGVAESGALADFKAVARDVALISEFKNLATSNFGGGNAPVREPEQDPQ